jgi:ribosomal protein L40E
MPPVKKAAQKPKKRICDRCGTLNATTATECSACGSERFAPDWVLHQRRINRQFAVQVTTPSPLSDRTDPRLTLSKWWPGGRATFHFPTAEQWEQVKSIVDADLGQFLGWQSRQAIQQAIRQQQKDSQKLDRDLTAAAKANPALFAEILKGLKLDRITGDNVGEIGRALSEVAGVLVSADTSMRRAITRIVKQLPDQGEEALATLSDLMEHLTVAQITAVANEVNRRVNLLTIFKERVLDDRTYEIRGANSIHRLLEQAMWIVDERYWLMNSNATLRTIIGGEIAKEFKEFEDNRPDFVCGSVDRRLIIIEIKRPSRVLQLEDLNQLERYVVIAQDHSAETSSFEAYLVGRKVSDTLRKHLKMRGSSFRVRTYTDLIQDTDQRYKQYLDALGQP